jgi:hypothetical protein
LSHTVNSVTVKTPNGALELIFNTDEYNYNFTTGKKLD